MSAVKLAPLVKTVEVRRAAEDAFRLFTQEIHAWWPVASHSRAVTAAGERTTRVDFEQRVGGRVYETLNTGVERDWGEVLAFEPGERVLLSFQMGRPKEQSGEVEVRFDPIDAQTCRVTLTHSHWERYGADASGMRERFSGGWEPVFVAGFGGFAGSISEQERAETLQIIGFPQSTYVRSVLMAAEEKGVPYEIVPAAPHTPEVRMAHPLGRIPAMRHGDLTLCESKAIATYMDEAFPGPRLIPDDLRSRAYVEQWVSLMNSGFQAAIGAYLGAYFFPGTADASPDRDRIDAVLEKLEHALDVIADGVAERGYLVGDSFTFADMAVLPSLSYLQDLPEASAMIAARPALVSYLARHEARPSVQATATPPPGARARAAVSAARAQAVA